jgi:autotransporter-associated beta strand protein
MRCVSLVSAVLLANSPPMVWGQPNVILIVSDDAGFVDFGFQGSPVIPTPNLNSLAQRGVAFTNAYTGAVCSPSRAMMVTGMYGARIGYETHIVADASVIDSNPVNQGLPEESVTIFERMQGLSYSTGLVGKWHLGMHRDRVQGGTLITPGNRPQRQGVEEFLGLLSGIRPYYDGTASGESRLRRTIVDASGNIDDQIVEGQFGGRYVTDIFGDESVAFIDRHYQDSDPFFLFTSFTAPHVPLEATPQDLAYIDAYTGRSLNGSRRTYAAMLYALDRNVGKILSKLDDPNGDGSTNDSIRDETLIMFLNDNGGSGTWSDNGPLRGKKGSQWEGGIRVPMLIAGAGVTTAGGSTFDAHVHSVDIVPTAFNLAGGTFGPDEVIDGVNLLPFINGAVTDDPHESLYLRSPGLIDVGLEDAVGERSAVRIGPWKLVSSAQDGSLLYNLDADPGETTDLSGVFPQVLDQLQHLMTDYDVQMDKARYDDRASETNQFDDFLFRGAAPAFDFLPKASCQYSNCIGSAKWSAADAWTPVSGANPVTMSARDAYANMVLVFPDGDYSAVNDLTRVGGLEFMANEIRFVMSSVRPVSPTTATIDGLPILLTKNLDGELPKLALDAFQPRALKDTYDLALPIKLYDDLEIDGVGNQVFVLSGGITEYRAGRSVTKTGTSKVVLTSYSEYTGATTIRGGEVELAEAGAALVGNAMVAVEEGGTLTLTNGWIDTTSLEINPGGTFNFDGGMLEAEQVTGTLTNSGGQFSLGSSTTTVPLAGDYTQLDSASLLVEIAGTEQGEFDLLMVMGDVLLSGVVEVRLLDTFFPTDGDRFTFITADELTVGSLMLSGDAQGFQIESSPTSLDLVFSSNLVPEPGSLVLILSAAAILLAKLGHGT